MLEEQMNARLIELRRSGRLAQFRMEWEEIARRERPPGRPHPRQCPRRWLPVLMHRLAMR